MFLIRDVTVHRLLTEAFVEQIYKTSGLRIISNVEIIPEPKDDKTEKDVSNGV